MKNIVVIYGGDDWDKKIPFKKNPATRAGFEDLYVRAKKYDIQYYRASIKWFDESKYVFKKVWTYDGQKWRKIQRSIKPDGIFDKVVGSRSYELFDLKMKMARKIPTVNHPLFKAITDNKLSQYLLFSNYMPKSFLATGKNELANSLNKIKTSKVVVKPLYGSGGKGIIIDQGNRIIKRKIQYPVLIQEFIKSNRGIPGFSKNKIIADLRLKYIDHKLTFALSRIAKKGSLFTNFHQGATAVLVPNNKIPKSAKKMAQNVIKKLSSFSGVEYSLDFIFTDSGKPVLVEMNTTPGYDLLNIIGDEKLKNKNVMEIARIFHDK